MAITKGEEMGQSQLSWTNFIFCMRSFLHKIGPNSGKGVYKTCTVVFVRGHHGNRPANCTAS